MTTRITVKFTSNTSIRIIYELGDGFRRIVQDRQGVNQLRVLDENFRMVPVSFEQFYDAINIISISIRSSFDMLRMRVESHITSVLTRLGHANDVITISSNLRTPFHYVHRRNDINLIEFEYTWRYGRFVLLVDNLSLEESKKKIEEYLQTAF